VKRSSFVPLIKARILRNTGLFLWFSAHYPNTKIGWVNGDGFCREEYNLAMESMESSEPSELRRRGEPVNMSSAELALEAAKEIDYSSSQEDIKGALHELISKEAALRPIQNMDNDVKKMYGEILEAIEDLQGLLKQVH
jgi:hypothetical protein